VNPYNTYFKVTFRELISLAILFLLLFVEPIKVGALKISEIWKGLVVVFLFFSVLNKRMPAYVWLGLIFAFKYLIYSRMPYGYLKAFSLSIEALIFPLMLGYLYYNYSRKNNIDNLIHLGLLLSLFLVFSAVPFMLGLESLYEEYDLSEKYNLNFAAPKGLFYHIASASKMFTVATVFIFAFRKRFMNNLKNKILWLVAFLTGTLLVALSWTRTAWLVYLGALFICIFYQSKVKTKLSGFVFFFVLVLGISFLYETNQAFRWRLTGGASYREEKELTFEQLAAARVPYIIVAIDNMKDEGPISTFIGYGTQRGIDLFDKKINMAITSHNKTFEIIESSGILGLIFYIIFLIALYRHLKKNWKYMDSFDKKIATVIFFLYISFYILSHGTPLWGELLYATFLVYIIIHAQRNKALYFSNNNVLESTI